MDFMLKIPAASAALVLHCFFWAFVVSRLAQGVHYCSPTPGNVVTISGESSGEIKTLLNGESSYGDKRDCVWVIDAGVDKRIWVEIVSSKLQWVPSGAICEGYDYMTIRNGSSSTATEIISWCGNHKPHSVLSTGRYLYLQFKTNDQNIYEYAGIYLRFGIYGVHYCSPTPGNVVTISGESSGEIKTLLNGESSYGDKRDCVWVIDAGVDKRIWVEIVSSKLQWAPSGAICEGYDYMTIRNGSSSTATEIISWCGNHKPHSVLSTGRYLYLQFKTNDQNIYEYAGIYLRFGTYDHLSCPPISSKWSNGNASLCITVFQEDITWISAQQHCGWVQSNLIKIYSADMAKFVTNQIVQKTRQSSYWIGLHDIARENSFLWIDGTKPTYNRLSGKNGVDEDDCVSVSTSSNIWSENNCDTEKPAYACSMFVGGPFPMYNIPKEGEYPEEPQEKVSPLLIGLITGGVFILIVVIIIIAVIVYMKVIKKGRQRSEKRVQEIELDNAAQSMQPESSRRSENVETENDSIFHVRSPAMQSAGATSYSNAHTSNPTAPPASPPRAYVPNPQPSSQHIAPPGYDEAISHPVFHYSTSNI